MSSECACGACGLPAALPYAMLTSIGWMRLDCLDRLVRELAYLGPVARAVLADNGAARCAGIRERVPFQPDAETLARLTDE